MWLWILAGLLLLLIWGGGFILSLLDLWEGTGTQVLLSVLVVLLVVAVLLIRRWRARAAARALERELLKQSEQQAPDIRPDRRAEVLELQRQMEAGIRALKQSRFGARHGASALYALPWYAIIGPPGAGKTTALKHSGLNFPFLDPRGGGVKGSGGTRNCDWWFTNDGILLDTAGRYATHDDDRDEWLAFLDLLKRYRSRSPLNGILVAVALPELVEFSEQQVEETAKRLRARVDEIMTRLDMVLPLYLVFTKCDLVSGFVEFWGDLRKSERDQIFGATFAASSTEDPRDAFVCEFDVLLSRLHSRAVEQIVQSRQLDARQQVFQYPLELRALRNTAAEFVGQLMQRNAFQENPVFRGFYFTSGTQEGQPVARLLGGMARAFGLQPPASQVPTDPKSYFVTDVFRRVVFPDQHLAAKTAGALRRELWMKLAALGAATLAALLILGPASCSFSGNRGLLGESRGAAATARGAQWGAEGAVKQKLDLLDRLFVLHQRLAGWRAEGPPYRLRWGMYVGDGVYPVLTWAYAQQLEEGMAEPTRTRLKAALRTLGAMRSVPPGQYGPHYNRLKLYLMLGTPERLDPEWAADRLTDEWNRIVRSPDDLELMHRHVRYYVDLIKRNEIAPWKLDMQLVSRARTVLLRAPQLERLYQALVADANAQVAPIRRETIFYGSTAEFVRSKRDLQVDGAYTKEGWERVRKLLTHRRSKLTSERWVLGEAEKAEAATDVERQVNRLRDMYFTRFSNAWRDFLADMEVAEPKDAESSLRELNALSEPEWAYLRMLRILHENVTLDVAQAEEPAEGAAGLLEKAKQKLQKEADRRLGAGAAGKPDAEAKPPRPVSPVEKAFKPLAGFAVAEGAKEGDSPPTGLSQYQELLAKLVGVLTDMRDADVSADTSKVAGEFEQAFRTTSGLLSNQTGFTRPLLSPYLMRPITAAWAGVVNDAGGAASGLWEVSVWETWHSKLEGRYPFVDAPDDVALADFTEFFRPQTGLLWSFYEGNLQASLKRSGSAFAPTRRFQSSVAYTNDFLTTCLSRGAKITDAMFPPKSEEPVVQFDINLHSVSEDVAEVSLEIDGVAQTYQNTPREWLATQWPAPEAEAHGATVRIRGYSDLDESVSREGPFGFFRLLDAADEIKPGTAGGRPNGTPTLVATWRVRSQQSFVKLDVRPARANTPLSTELFRGYQCPRVIAHQQSK